MKSQKQFLSYSHSFSLLFTQIVFSEHLLQSPPPTPTPFPLIAFTQNTVKGMYQNFSFYSKVKMKTELSDMPMPQ